MKRRKKSERRQEVAVVECDVYKAGFHIFNRKTKQKVIMSWIRRENALSGLKSFQSADPGEYGFHETFCHW